MLRGQKNRQKDKYNRGITLMTLVITIIVLLILTGITIAGVTNKNGVIRKAKRAKEETRIAQIQEKVHEWNVANMSSNELGNNHNHQTMQDLLNKLKQEGLLTNQEYNQAVATLNSENPKITIGKGSSTIEIEINKEDEMDIPETPPSPNPGNPGTGSSEPDIPSNPPTPKPPEPDPEPGKPQEVNPALKDIKVGDIIKYEPRRDVKDATKLSYTSPVGDTNGTTTEYYGNGSKEQTITAEAGLNEWVVVKNDQGKLHVLSVKPTTQKFELRGGQGWLYSERELNYACSVYGHGKGADKSQVTEYRVGNPIVAGEARTEYLRGSGARSFSLQDLEKLGNITEEDKKKMDDDYKKTGGSGLRVPTIMAANTQKQSDRAYSSKQGLVNTFYNMNGGYFNKFGVLRGRIISEVPYYLSSSEPQIHVWRDRDEYTDYVYFCILYICGSKGRDESIFRHDDDYKTQNASIGSTSRSLRPIVTLRTDIQLEQTTAGVYKIK